MATFLQSDLPSYQFCLKYKKNCLHSANWFVISYFIYIYGISLHCLLQGAYNERLLTCYHCTTDTVLPLCWMLHAQTPQMYGMLL